MFSDKIIHFFNHVFSGYLNRTGRLFKIAVLFSFLWGIVPEGFCSTSLPQCLRALGPDDSMVVADPSGRIIFKHNISVKRIPASTLKLLTSLSAIDNLGPEYRFKTKFYSGRRNSLVIKGYGDPLLISEIWLKIAEGMSHKMKEVNDIIVDDSYFHPNIVIPGRKHSTNPYDAPVGALCANFNTVFFSKGRDGRFISAEPQTPIIPFALKRIKSLGMNQGRYTFSHKPGDAARYAGELFLHFLANKGVKFRGEVLAGSVEEGDSLIYEYYSDFTLEELLMKMLEFSNNFIANQLIISMGAHAHNPPGTLEKGMRVVRDYAKLKVGLTDINMVEGSGISRKNRLSAIDMLAILQAFRPYRRLLKKEGPFLYKTGTLRHIRTRAGFYDKGDGAPYTFAIFLNRQGPNIESLMKAIKGMAERNL
ncbi:D-alanyl-D-alanine carboxypeptidase/D-alanyl-D-alanine-endopeptidase [Thermodesulfobacteriota bacterium]